MKNENAAPVAAAPSAATGKAAVTTINLDEVAMRRIRETYIDAFGPLPPEVMVNDIDGHICQLIADAATGKAVYKGEKS